MDEKPMSRSEFREKLESEIDGSSDAEVLRGVAKILEGESLESDRQGTDIVTDLYRIYCARLEAMAESLEPTTL